MRIKYSRPTGFSLIELAIVMLIVGVLMSGFLQFYSVMQQKKQYDATNQRLRDIRTALTLYVITHGNLPCPAGPSGDYSADQCAKGTDPAPGVERYNIDPSSSILIDDNLRNIKGAEAVGINGIHFINAQQLKDDLAKWNIYL